MFASEWISRQRWEATENVSSLSDIPPFGAVTILASSYNASGLVNINRQTTRFYDNTPGDVRFAGPQGIARSTKGHISSSWPAVARVDAGLDIAAGMEIGPRLTLTGASDPYSLTEGWGFEVVGVFADPVTNGSRLALVAPSVRPWSVGPWASFYFADYETDTSARWLRWTSATLSQSSSRELARSTREVWSESGGILITNDYGGQQDASWTGQIEEVILPCDGVWAIAASAFGTAPSDTDEPESSEQFTLEVFIRRTKHAMPATVFGSFPADYLQPRLKFAANGPVSLGSPLNTQMAYYGSGTGAFGALAGFAVSAKVTALDPIDITPFSVSLFRLGPIPEMEWGERFGGESFWSQ